MNIGAGRGRGLRSSRDTAAPEGEKLGEENLSFPVLGLGHAADLRVEVHGFRGGVHKNRAFGAWIDPQYLMHLQ